MKTFIVAAFVAACIAMPQVQATNIDLQQPVPASITLVVGQTVIFENESAKVTATETDGNGPLFLARPHNTFNQSAAFAAKRIGEGKFTVEFAAIGQQPAVNKQTIKVKVVAAPTTHTINYSKKPFPNLNGDLEVTISDTITVEVRFKGDAGLFDPFLTPQVVTSDKQKGNVLEALRTPVRRKDANTIEAWKFKALRKGTADIRFVDPAGKIRGTVKITVK